MWARSQSVWVVSRPSGTSANVSATVLRLLGHLTPLRRVEGGQVTEPVLDRRHEIEHRWRGFPKNGPAWCPGHTLS
jgi:hypothetical protein